MITKKNSKSARINRRSNYIIAAIMTLLLAITVGYMMYQDHLAKQDAERFSQLQSDFKKLQVEFNKIDPGWEYSEGCTAGGGVFTEEDDISCTVEIKNESIHESVSSAKVITDRYAEQGVALNIFTSVIKDSSYTHKGVRYDNRLLSYAGVDKGVCEIGSTLKDGSIVTSVSCRNEARSLYFSRTDK